MEILPNEVVFINKCAEKADEGEYIVDLVNEKGQDTCDLKVKVKGKVWYQYTFYMPAVLVSP